MDDKILSRMINELIAQEAIHEANRQRCYSLRTELQRKYAATPRKGSNGEIRAKIIATRQRTMFRK